MSLRFQFGTSTLLLATAFAGICLTGMGAAIKVISPNGVSADLQEWRWVIAELCLAGPFYLPAIFIAYALGRRALTARAVLAFALLEAIVVACLKLLVDNS
jgi:hypothetical protein